ncbi:Disease resistance protein RPM1 [Hordeum vulgare]|nr:Disease resistance protein RPM1 [Hordeum vulgare]
MSPRAAPLARMPRLSDASIRPAEHCVVIPATPKMQVESALLSTNGAVAWLDGARQNVSCQHVASELAMALDARQADVEVVRHYPEKFFVRFMHQHYSTLAVSRGHLPGACYLIYAREWRHKAHANNED